MLGATSWPSTVRYYRILNELAQQRLGGFHSANLILRTIDYPEIRSRHENRWDEVPAQPRPPASVRPLRPLTESERGR